MDKMSVSQPRDRGFESHTRVTTMIPYIYGTSTGWFQEADSRVILISSENLVHSRAKINTFKLN